MTAAGPLMSAVTEPRQLTAVHPRRVMTPSLRRADADRCTAARAKPVMAGRKVRTPRHRARGTRTHREVHGMTDPDVHGSADFVLIEFPANRSTGRAGDALRDLAKRGIVPLYDVLVIGKPDGGSVYALDLSEAADERLGGF